MPKQRKILAETYMYLTYAPLASFVTPSTKDHEVRNRLAHTTDDVVKKARCACTHNVIQDGAEKADERRKMLLQSSPQYHRMPKIRMRSPNVERKKCLRSELPICNKCSAFEENEDVEGWTAGKNVAYCQACDRGFVTVVFRV